MCTEHDFRNATAVREFLTMKHHLFVDRHTAIVINENIEYLCIK